MIYSREYVVAKMVIDRNFDVPDWVYEFINMGAITELIELLPSTTKLKEDYCTNPNMRRFFSKVRDGVKFKRVECFSLFTKRRGLMAVLLLNKREWKYIRSIILDYDNSDMKIDFLNNIICTSLLKQSDMFNLIKDCIEVLNLDKHWLIDFVNSKTTNLSSSQFDLSIYKVTELLNVNEDYGLCNYCLGIGIPVFFKNGDIVDLYRYLSVIKARSWDFNIDSNISKVHISSSDTEIIDMIKYIYIYINHSIIVYSKKMMDDELFDDTFRGPDFLIGMLSMKSVIDGMVERKSGNKYGIKDFNDLIGVFGSNSYGLPMPVQENFIISKGDIKTMFKGDKLLPEATIIKTPGKIEYLIKFLDIEDLRYILYNSPEFIKVIMTSYNDITRGSYARILKALFENPINEDLWKVLNENGYSQDLVDYREVLIRKIISILTLDTVFTMVPEAMLYIEPSALFVTRNLSSENIPFIPITKLLPYLSSIISQNEYVKFNRYCNGVYVPLTKVVPANVLDKNIISCKKLGYIGDISIGDTGLFIDTYK